MKIICILALLLGAYSSILVADEQYPGEAFITAIDAGDLNAVESLVGGGASANTLIQSDQVSTTPLMWACTVAQRDIASYLIQAGANVNFANEKGTTPLISAVEASSLELVQLLIQNGASVSAANNAQFTPLNIAAAAGNDGIITALVQAGASIQTETAGLTPLMIAASASKLSTIILLVNFGAPINQASSISGQTALFSAVNTGEAEIVQSLINLGADVNFQTSDGNTPLKTAANGNRMNIVEILKAAGANQ